MVVKDGMAPLEEFGLLKVRAKVELLIWLPTPVPTVREAPPVIWLLIEVAFVRVMFPERARLLVFVDGKVSEVVSESGALMVFTAVSPPRLLIVPVEKPRLLPPDAEIVVAPGVALVLPMVRAERGKAGVVEISTVVAVEAPRSPLTMAVSPATLPGLFKFKSQEAGVFQSSGEPVGATV